MLTDTGIRRARAKEKRYMISDGNGLYIEVMPSGKKYWRLRYWLNKKEYKKSLGPYPEISLKEARDLRDQIKRSVVRTGQPVVATNTFEAVANEWLEKKVLPIRTPRHIETVTSRLRRFVFPHIGQKPIGDITSPDVLALLREMEDREIYESAHRVRQIIGQVFRYGIATGVTERDITADLKGALIPVNSNRYPTITDPVEIGALMRAIESLDTLVVRCALLLQAYTFVRPGELRKAEWSEFDMKGQEWRIPAEKMKMKRLHIVPLSDQAISVLKEIYPVTGLRSKYVFPTVRDPNRPMSDATANAALRRLGYEKEKFTGHGFRSMASTILNEHGWPPDVIERQLAHIERNAVRAAYNHAEYLDQRREMMQWWGNWLEEVRGTNKH